MTERILRRSQNRRPIRGSIVDRGIQQPDRAVVYRESIVDNLVKAKWVFDKPSIEVVGDSKAEEKREKAVSVFNSIIAESYKRGFNVASILKEVDEKLYPKKNSKSVK